LTGVSPEVQAALQAIDPTTEVKSKQKLVLEIPTIKMKKGDVREEAWSKVVEKPGDPLCFVHHFTKFLVEIRSLRYYDELREKMNFDRSLFPSHEQVFNRLVRNHTLNLKNLEKQPGEKRENRNGKVTQPRKKADSSKPSSTTVETATMTTTTTTTTTTPSSATSTKERDLSDIGEGKIYLNYHVDGKGGIPYLTVPSDVSKIFLHMELFLCEKLNIRGINLNCHNVRRSSTSCK